MIKVSRFSIYFVAMTMSVALLSVTAFWPQQAYAHKDHAGSLVTFMGNKKVLKSMLPEEAKIVKRTEKLSDSDSEWGEKTFAVDLDSKVYRYYLARDKSTKALLGGAISAKFDYRHGEVLLVVGLDDQQRITKAALNGVSEKYTPDFEGTVGTGYLSAYEGKTIETLVSEARQLSAADKPSRFLATKLAETAALLAAFMHGAR